MKRTVRAAAGLFLAGAASCVNLETRREASEEREIRFSHRVHAGAGLECAACHAEIQESKALDGRVLPKELKCLECHADWKQAGQCQKCHLEQPPRSWPARVRTVRIDHAAHLPRVNGDCTACHKALPEPSETLRLTPPMEVCLSCHNHQQDYRQNRCQPCHLEMTHLGLRPVAYFSHEGNYLSAHRLAARTAAGTCAQCHEQTFCSDCHAQTVATPVEYKFPERVDRQFIHRDDYVSRHQIEASADPALCQRCHGVSFCQTCHAQVGLSQSSANPLNPHPPGWNSPGTPQFHGPAAQRDIYSCQSCHDRGASSNCVACHRVGAIGGNPHPPAFLRSHGSAEIARQPMCQICHP